MTEKDTTITAIGLGSVGSQVFMNFARMGYGKWYLVDNDILLPHNLARHSLLSCDIGYSKTERLSLNANKLFRINFTQSIPTNILHSKNELLDEAIKNSNVLLDMSASIPVARKLSIDIESSAKRISVFLSPSGRDGIILCEDGDRKMRIDFLEMIYYRYLTENEELHNHLQRKDERLRIGNSCRDVSLAMAQDFVAIHSGIFTRAIRTCISSNEAMIKIWRINNDLGVTAYTCPCSECSISKIGEWTIITNNELLKKMSAQRISKFPVETGGVLIGSHDMQRKVLYIVDTIPSPIDSVEWPTVYIRGCRGLEREIKNVSDVTANNLYYIGEWHSHPEGFSCLPSSDDKKAFLWLTDLMGDYGFPALMIIAGERFGFYLGEMK